jgi:hypothetical protein
MTDAVEILPLKLNLRLSARRREAQAQKTPGCFGSPALFESESEECSRCKFSESCRAVGIRERDDPDGNVLAMNRFYALPGVPRPLPSPVAAMALIILIRRYHFHKWQKSASLYARNDRARKRIQRSRTDPAAQLTAEYRKRVNLLRKAVRCIRGDKFLEQLRGREERLAKVWLAEALAQSGAAKKVSAAVVASRVREMTGLHYSRDQARADRQNIEKLERNPLVWGRFKKVAPS